ncbi:hypothetical protein CRG98_034747, partial [Punica granatum]
MAFEGDLNLEATELRLGLPGTADHDKSGVTKSNKRGLQQAQSSDHEESNIVSNDENKRDHQESTRPA